MFHYIIVDGWPVTGIFQGHIFLLLHFLSQLRIITNKGLEYTVSVNHLEACQDVTLQ